MERTDKKMTTFPKTYEKVIELTKMLNECGLKYDITLPLLPSEYKDITRGITINLRNGITGEYKRYKVLYVVSKSMFNEQIKNILTETEIEVKQNNLHRYSGWTPRFNHIALMKEK